MNVWKKAKDINLNITFNCEYKFLYDFEENIDMSIENELISFMQFILDKYTLKTPVIVRFYNKDSLIDKNGKDVGFIFYWADYDNYPNIYSDEGLPEIELPVKNTKWSIDEILTSFIEALTMYYAWCLNIMHDGYDTDKSVVDSILNEYKKCQKYN